MKHKVISLLSLTLAAFLAGACYSIDSTQKEWTEQGERIYTGRLDSMTVRSGFYRAEIVGNPRYLRTAVTCTVEYDGGSQKFTLSDVLGADGKVRMLITDLSEGSYYFTVRTFDSAGNPSIPITVYGQVYGAKRLLTKSPKRISSMVEKYDGTLELTWNDAEADYYELTYTDAEGLERTIRLEGGTEKTVLQSWMRSGDVTIRTYILENADDLDYLALDPVTTVFPDQMQESIPLFGPGSRMNLGPVHDWDMLEEFTVECMVRYNELAGGDQCIFSTEYGAGGFQLRNSGPNIQWYISDNAWGWNLGGQRSIVTGRWYHLAAVFKANDHIALYIDGERVGWNACNGISQGANIDLCFGSPITYSGRCMRGNIQHISIWANARSDEQVVADMAFDFSTDDPDLKAYWPLKYNYGDELPDMTGRHVAYFTGVRWEDAE